MVSVEFASVTIAILMLYLFLYFNEIRWKRMVGCFAIMIVSIGLGVVADSIPMFILMSVNMLIVLLKFIEDIGELLSVFNQK